MVKYTHTVHIFLYNFLPKYYKHHFTSGKNGGRCADLGSAPVVPLSCIASYWAAFVQVLG